MQWLVHIHAHYTVHEDVCVLVHVLVTAAVIMEYLYFY